MKEACLLELPLYRVRLDDEEAFASAAVISSQ
jgi:hypothetical protein